MDFETQDALRQFQDAINQIAERLAEHRTAIDQNKLTSAQATETTVEIVDVLKQHSERLDAIEDVLKRIVARLPS